MINNDYAQLQAYSELRQRDQALEDKLLGITKPVEQVKEEVFKPVIVKENNETK